MFQGDCGIIPTVSCRKTGNRSIRGYAAHDSCTKVSRSRSRRGETRIIRNRHMLGGVSCVIPLGIPVASLAKVTWSETKGRASHECRGNQKQSGRDDVECQG